MPLLKLIKLIYLAERLSFGRYGEPLVGDRLVSMNHGPVLSRVYDLMKGTSHSSERGWNAYISARHGHNVSLLNSANVTTPETDLLALSDSDLEILQETWDQYGQTDRFDLVEYLHENMPEWEYPNGSSRPITYDRLFSALGYSEEQSKLLQSRIAEQDYIARSVAA